MIILVVELRFVALHRVYFILRHGVYRRHDKPVPFLYRCRILKLNQGT